MVDITPVLAQGAQRIDGYGDGGFTVSGAWHEGSLIVYPEHTQPWDINVDDSILDADFSMFIKAVNPPEIVLVGAGHSGIAVPLDWRNAFREAGIGVEVMDTGAACRTYNVLLAEGRMVAAALQSI